MSGRSVSSSFRGEAGALVIMMNAGRGRRFRSDRVVAAALCEIESGQGVSPLFEGDLRRTRHAELRLELFLTLARIFRLGQSLAPSHVLPNGEQGLKP